MTRPTAVYDRGIVQPDSKPSDSTASRPTIRCLHCDYDLRGLAGDPVRCPECGAYTAFAAFSARLAIRPKAGDFNLFAMFALLLLCVTAGIALWNPVFGLAGLFPIVLWLVWMFVVRRHAGGTPGWLAISLKHQALVLAATVVFLALVPLSVGAVGVAMSWADWIGGSRGTRRAIEIVASAFLISPLAAAFMTFVERGGKAAQRLFD